MDINFEKKIGDAIVTLKGGRHKPGPERQIRMAAAFPATGTPSAEEVAAFIAPLHDHGEMKLDGLKNLIAPRPLPSGYRHFRLFVGETGAPWNQTFVVEEGRSFTAHDVLYGALDHPTLELASWRRTDWLPDAIPGVLDLEISITTRERTQPFALLLGALPQAGPLIQSTSSKSTLKSS